MEANQNLLSSELRIEPSTQVHLKEAAMWGRFLGIVGIVLSVLIAIFGLFAGAILSNFRKGFGGGYGGADMAAGAGVITVIYLVIAVVYFLMSLYLYRFGAKMKMALLTTDQASLDSSFHHLKLVYRILGIVTIIYLGLMAIALLTGIAGAAFMR